MESRFTTKALNYPQCGFDSNSRFTNKGYRVIFRFCSLPLHPRMLKGSYITAISSKYTPQRAPMLTQEHQTGQRKLCTEKKDLHTEKLGFHTEKLDLHEKNRLAPQINRYLQSKTRLAHRQQDLHKPPDLHCPWIYRAVPGPSLLSPGDDLD